ncbi:MAG TPA: DcaP family trimeric outer membrane transporter [Solimonas sp.]|nr:DcaP family trimeric outer membrane transporter [Solimonas sp.]
MTKHSSAPRRHVRSLRAFAATGVLALAGPVLADSSGDKYEAPHRVELIPVQPLRTEPAPASMHESYSTPQTSITWGGFVKVDGIFSDFDKGDALVATGRDFFVPASIPVGSADNHEASLDAHAKETRLFIKSETDFGGGVKVGGYVEFDFLVSQGTGTAAVTNAYNLGLRRAYITYGNWLVGQDWTTFQDLAALPEGLDFIGPTEGTVFNRQPLLRYTTGPWAVALENPETSVLPNAGDAAALSNDNIIPDLVVRYTFKSDWGQVSVAGLARQLRSRVAPVSDEVIGGGVSVMGKIPVLGQDDVRFSIASGEGIGRYVGINTLADAVVLPDNQLDAIGLTGGYVAYHHPWNEEWRSNLTVSALVADTTSAMGGATTHKVTSARASLLYSPVPKLTFGVEVMRAERQASSGLDGALNRVQASAKYAF